MRLLCMVVQDKSLLQDLIFVLPLLYLNYITLH